MLVVDLHTLQTIHLLDFVDDVLLHLLRTLDVQDVHRGQGAFGQRRTGFHEVVLLSQNLFGRRDEIGLGTFAGIDTRGDFHHTVTAFQLLLEGDHTVDFGDHGGIAGVTSLEQFGHARQTARDIAGLTEGTQNLDQDFTGIDDLTLFHGQTGTHGNVEALDDVAVLIHNVEARVLRLETALDDHLVVDVGLLVSLHTVGHALDDVVELDSTGHVGQNHGVERIPIGDQVALLDGVAMLEIEVRTVRHVSG